MQRAARPIRRKSPRRCWRAFCLPLQMPAISCSIRFSSLAPAARGTADGCLTLGPALGSIHKIGALAQGLPACNGWTFWHVERAGALTLIDDMRANIRTMMREAAE